MKQTFDSDQTIIRYLLNELSADDQAQFEEAYLRDGSLFEQVQALEEELIEDYVKGELSGHERHRFEHHYLTSDQRRARIEAAKQLIRVCSLISPKQTVAVDRAESKFFSLRPQLQMPVMRYLAPAFGIAAVLLLLVGSGLLIEVLRLRRQLAVVSQDRVAIAQRAEESAWQSTREREQLTEVRKQSMALQEKLEDLTSQLERVEQERNRPQASKNQIYSLTLTPGIRDIGKPDKAIISAHTNFVELRVNLERQETTTSGPYRLIVKTVEGDREIWTEEGIKPQRSRSAWHVVVRVPTNRFITARVQDFTLTLGTLTAAGKDYEELESYYFQVISK